MHDVGMCLCICNCVRMHQCMHTGYAPAQLLSVHGGACACAQVTTSGFSGACPQGWSNRGLAALSFPAAQMSASPFTAGPMVDHTSRWAQGYLCCAQEERARMDTLFLFAAQCPAGTQGAGQYGAIVQAAHEGSSPFARGGAFSGDWRWAHPQLCRAGTSDAALGSGSCLLGRACPQGWSSRGLFGVALANAHYGLNPFLAGGHANAAMRWVHPFMCCRD